MGAKEKKEERRWWMGPFFPAASLLMSIIVFCYGIYRDRSAAHSNGERFGKIETSIRLLTQAVAPQLYQSIHDSLGKLTPTTDPADLHEALDSTRTAINQLKAAKVVPDPRSAQVGRALADVTLTHSNYVEPWKVAAQFISFKYQGSPENLGACIERPFDDFKFPDPAGLSTLSGAVPVYDLVFHDCTFVIDDVAALRKSEPYARYQLTVKSDPLERLAISLIRVHVVYRGGTLPKVTTLMIQDCTFEWDQPPAVPAEPEKRLMRGLLLATLGEKSTIPIGSGI